MVGTVKEAGGMVFSHDKFKVVHQIGAKGDKIERHNHPEAQVLFTVVKGKIKVFLNGEEEHVLEPGKILNFDGDNYINAELLEDSQAFVTLIMK